MTIIKITYLVLFRLINYKILTYRLAQFYWFANYLTSGHISIQESIDISRYITPISLSQFISPYHQFSHLSANEDGDNLSI